MDVVAQSSVLIKLLIQEVLGEKDFNKSEEIIEKLAQNDCYIFSGAALRKMTKEMQKDALKAHRKLLKEYFQDLIFEDYASKK